MEADVNECLREDVSEAATEIIADFPQATKIEASFKITAGPIPAENVIDEGWVFRRAE